MFVQIFRGNGMFIMVNINHIVSIEPNQRNAVGCTIILSTGLTFQSVDNYDTVLENIKNAN